MVSAAERDEKRATGGVPVVLVLCADEAVRASIAYWATAMRLVTCIATDGYHANRILREESCTVLVTDRILPPWPGLDTFPQLRERNPHLRIAFIEGASHEHVGLARMTGATDVLARPLRQRAFAELLTPVARS